jgi:hypothetical protein
MGCFFAAKTGLQLSKQRPGLLPLLLMARVFTRLFVETVLELASECSVTRTLAAESPLEDALHAERARLQDLESFHDGQKRDVVACVRQLRHLLEGLLSSGGSASAVSARVGRQLQDCFGRTSEQLKVLESREGQAHDQWLRRVQKAGEHVTAAAVSLPEVLTMTCSPQLHDSCLVLESQAKSLRHACRSFASVERGCEEQRARVLNVERLAQTRQRDPTVFDRPDWFVLLLRHGVNSLAARIATLGRDEDEDGDGDGEQNESDA